MKGWLLQRAAGKGEDACEQLRHSGCQGRVAGLWQGRWHSNKQEPQDVQGSQPEQCYPKGTRKLREGVTQVSGMVRVCVRKYAWEAVWRRDFRWQAWSHGDRLEGSYRNAVRRNCEVGVEMERNERIWELFAISKEICSPFRNYCVWPQVYLMSQSYV